MMKIHNLRERSIGLAVLFFLISLQACATISVFPRHHAPVVDDFFPKKAFPGEELYIRGKNFKVSNEFPKVYVAGVPAEVVRAQENRIIVRIPNIVGEGPLRVRTRGGVFETRNRVMVQLTRTLRYPSDRPYFLPPAFFQPAQISPFGQNQKVLVMVGVPTDVTPRFTLQELVADINNRFSIVNQYWRTISKENNSFEATVFNQIVPLQKTYGEYISEVRYPVARGTPVPFPVDLRNYPNRQISMEVTGPDGVSHTLTANLPASDFALWSQIDGVLYSANMGAYFVGTTLSEMFLDIIPYGQGEEDFRGNGYQITRLIGDAWEVLGLRSPQFVAGSGEADMYVGFDLDYWEDEIQDYVDSSDFSSETFQGKNYMLIGTPTLDPYLPEPPLPYGYLEKHHLRAAAAVSYGWMRLPHNATWATWAHETGHNLSLGDQYLERIEQPGEFPGVWTLMAYHTYESHVSAWEKGDYLRYSYQTSWLPPSSICEAVPPGPDGSVRTSTFVLAPQYTPLPSNLPGISDPICYALKVPLSTSHYLIAEGRQDQPETSPRRFDEQLDTLDLTGGVVAYDIRDGRLVNEVPNVWRRDMILLTPPYDPLDPGESYSDPSIGVTVRVLDQIGVSPLSSFRVAVDWGQMNPPPGQNFDAYITPWDSRWQSPDIWVDSPLNDWDVYESQIFTPDGDPDGAGDTIAVLEQNRLKARIRNLGPQTIPGATVNFWVATPAGIGDRGDWQRLNPSEVGPIPAGGSRIAETTWVPTGSGHTCVIVEAAPLQGEIDFGNNKAQENFSNFEARSSSAYTPLDFSFLLSNPFPHKAQFSLRARRTNPGVGLKLDYAYPVIEKGGKLEVRGAVTLNERVIPPHSKYDTDLSVAAYYPVHDSERELGGINLHLQPRRLTKIEAKFEEYEDGYLARGKVTGGTFPRKVSFSVHVNKKFFYFWDKTGRDGAFVSKIPLKEKGLVEVFAYVPASHDYSSSRSESFRFERR